MVIKNRKIFLINLILILVFCLPFLAYADAYVRSPTGFEITSPVNITAENVLNWDNNGDCQDNITGNWFIFLTTDYNGNADFVSSNFPYTQMYASVNFNLPIGTEVWEVGYGCNGHLVGSFEGDALDVIFKIISSSQGFSFNLPSNSISSISDTSTGVVGSVWVLLQMLIGIPIGFYILRKLVIGDLILK